MKEILNAAMMFDPISLDEMDAVKLMDRVDSKYVFPASQLPGVLQQMQDQYRLLEINQKRIHRYHSLYFDTEDLQFYRRHHMGKLNRWKLRFRKYVDSGNLTFFEIKFKNNMGRTIKKRVKMQDIGERIEQKAEKFLHEITPFSSSQFFPTIWVNYSRMTFVNKTSRERLTIDTSLSYTRADREGQSLSVSFPQMVIAEAKRDKAGSVSSFIRLVRANGIREGSISKYCFGIYNLFETVKKNNFKPKVRFIQKMAGMA